jgi:hypothetical protein
VQYSPYYGVETAVYIQRSDDYPWLLRCDAYVKTREFSIWTNTILRHPNKKRRVS